MMTELEAVRILLSPLSGPSARYDAEILLVRSPGKDETVTTRGLRHAPRGAEVYLVQGTSSTYRIRAEKYPDHSEPASGWFGGRVLWGYDQPTMKAALHIAQRWVIDGTLPGNRAS